ncbi:MAG: sodium:alanine symporter family protein [Sphaerochaetaceae bacterium]|nr:sodium:alanine symporter family protein [Sphaerochaetaceae bacterium]
MSDFLNTLDNLIWGVPLIVIILVTGIFLSIGLHFLQISKLRLALKNTFKGKSNGKGEISSFAALCTALSATIGTGNMIGVATAICQGGPGALFWMIVAAFFGMATKYSEGFLAIRFRKINEDGSVTGGPFAYIEYGLGKNFKFLAVLFAIFGIGVALLGIGTFTQVNGITNAAGMFFDPNNNHTISMFGNQYPLIVSITGLILTFLVGLVIIGGLKRISKVAEKIVPFMAVSYILIGIIFIVFNIKAVPAAIVEIVKSAFGMKAVSGGAIGTMIIAMQKGIARGIFSNEAGLGSAPIAAASAKAESPVHQGLISMTGTFFDTIIICTITGLTIVITGAWNIGKEGIAVTSYAFETGLPFPHHVTAFIIMICLMVFAFTTILGWNFYGERCLAYLSNNNKKMQTIYRIIFMIAIFIGPYFTLSQVWTIADIVNGLMAIPNIIALLLLSPVIFKETREFIKGNKLY